MPRNPNRCHPALLPSAALLVSLASPATAQADFFEPFESNGTVPAGQSGPSGLTSAGWIFRNQSSPAEGAAWYDGDGFGTEPFQGTGYLASSGLATDFFGGAVSSWAILPDIPGLQAGDLVTLWIFGGGSASQDSFFEIRQSLSGLSTGVGPQDTGDFDQVLFTTELPAASQGYTRVTAQVPAAGPIALRFHSPYLQTFAGNGANFAIDSLTVGPAADGPCGLDLPDAGETVVWAAGGTHQICQDLTIPEGATLEISPGAQVEIQAGSVLRVEGTLNATGTPSAPVSITGPVQFDTSLEIAGEANIAFADVAVNVSVGGEDATLILTDSSIAGGAEFTGVPDLVVIERCAFTAGASLGGFGGLNGSIRVTDTTFADGAGMDIGGLMHLDGISADNAPLSFRSETWAYPVLIENITATNNAAGPGLAIEGPNFLIGQGVTLQNNRTPISMTGLGAGILPGSAIPLTGNTLNQIETPDFSLAQQRQWASTGLPYIVLGGFPANYGGSIKVEPGANIKFGPGAGAFIVTDAEVDLQGTADRPILLESLQPGPGRWFGLKWVDNFDAKARHTIFDGGEITVQSDGGVIDLTHCTVRNSLEGTASVTGGIVRLFGSSIIDNAVGMVTTTSGRIEADGGIAPSVFEGNNLAIEYNNTSGLPYLRFNWWGDETGPTSPLWPDGRGDPVQNVHPSAFFPFLESPPEMNDEFPVIEMEPTYFIANTGEKIILRWSSSDDTQVVEHRIEFAGVDFPDDYSVIATLPGDATTYEFDVPEVLPTNRYPTPSAIRIVAVDSAGQESWDKTKLRIPYHADWNVVYQDVSDPGTVHPWDTFDVCWTPGGSASAYLLLDGAGFSKSNGGSNTGCLAIGAKAAYASTDTARNLIVTTFGAGGRVAYSFSDYFEIRPDPRFGDAPPQVTLSSPAQGESFGGGTTIPVRWTASDDEGLRSFRVQASYDSGKTWHGVASELPGSARAFDWDLPASAGIPDTRVRVVATDHRFQDSSATSGPFSIAAGDGPNGCNPADIAEPYGVLDLADVQAFIAGFTAQLPIADLDANGVHDLADIQIFIASFNAGCP